MRQYFSAVLPRWPNSSDARGLSQIINIRGAITRAVVQVLASYTSIPVVSNTFSSETICSLISKGVTLSEQHTKWIFDTLLFSWRGRPASKRYQQSNLCHFLLRLPLVSSQNKISGTIITGRPLAFSLSGWGVRYLSMSCKDINKKVKISCAQRTLPVSLAFQIYFHPILEDMMKAEQVGILESNVW